MVHREDLAELDAVTGVGAGWLFGSLLGPGTVLVVLALVLVGAVAAPVLVLGGKLGAQLVLGGSGALLVFALCRPSKESHR